MTVEFTDEEYKEIYDIFEKLMSPVSSITDLAEAIRGENRVWQVLKDKAASCGVLPLPEEHPIESEPTSQDA
jgi:hypothetical protein